jgi:hypothetical protein
MRVFVRREIAGGGAVPTATEVIEAVGGTVSLALQVLAAFPQHRAAQLAHERPSLRTLRRDGGVQAGLMSKRPPEDAVSTP